MLDPTPHHPPHPPPPDGPEQKSVLVVEDDPGIALLIAAILDNAGYSTYVVGDGRRALQAVHELQPAVMTLDLELPDMDGHMVLRSLIEERPDERLPIVVVSGSTDVLSREERRHIARALTKPFDLVDLVDAIDKVAALETS